MVQASSGEQKWGSFSTTVESHGIVLLDPLSRSPLFLFRTDADDGKRGANEARERAGE